ncbi:hypothetical protein IMY05_C1152001100 [Salix suchowensis]|nr:hypothetical protein IMY05_C1152001100 [Salix suchowensis]
MPHLRAIYSSASGNVRLNTYPQYELHYSTGYTHEELDRIRDPSWTPGHEAQERVKVLPSSSSASTHYRVFNVEGIPKVQDQDEKELPKEVKRLLVHGLDGCKWDNSDIVGTRSQMKAAAKAAEEANPKDIESISTSTTSTAPGDISVHAIRVTDAMFLIRTSLNLYRTFFPDADTVPGFPAIAFELKEGHHSPIDRKTICRQEYYICPEPAAYLVPARSSVVVPIIDSTDGEYSDEFKALFKEAIKDATSEYNTFILSSIPKCHQNARMPDIQRWAQDVSKVDARRGMKLNTSYGIRVELKEGEKDRSCLINAPFAELSYKRGWAEAAPAMLISRG